MQEMAMQTREREGERRRGGVVYTSTLKRCRGQCMLDPASPASRGDGATAEAESGERDRGADVSGPPTRHHRARARVAPAPAHAPAPCLRASCLHDGPGAGPGHSGGAPPPPRPPPGAPGPPARPGRPAHAGAPRRGPRPDPGGPEAPPHLRGPGPARARRQAPAQRPDLECEPPPPHSIR